MSDAIARLNAALEGRYAIERELGEGGMVCRRGFNVAVRQIPRQAILTPALGGFKCTSC